MISAYSPSGARSSPVPKMRVDDQVRVRRVRERVVDDRRRVMS